MAATIAGAIKAYLEGQGLGISVYHDIPPAKAKATLPYCTVVDGIAVSLEKLEDGASSTGTEEVQLDLWQQWRDANDKTTESPTLADAITEALQGTQLNTSGSGAPPKRVYAVLQKNRIRTVDRNARLVRHLYTLDVTRVI